MREAELSVPERGLAAMGLDGLLSLVREAGLIAVDELACRGTGGVVQVEVETRLDEDRLADLDPVDEWTHVATRHDSEVYVVAVTAPALPERLEGTADELVGTCDPEIDDDGATMSLVGPHEAISSTVREFEAADAAPALQRIGRYDGPDRPLAALTDRQREVVETAWEMGYYEVPKEVAAADVAAELGLDTSTVNEHLQRAERNLLARLL